jgi:hypothetical protein
VGRCTPGCATRLVPPTPVARRRGDEPRHSGPGPPECCSLTKATRPETGSLHMSPRFHVQPIDQVFFLEPYPVNPVRPLILGRAVYAGVISWDTFAAWAIR